MIKKSLLSKWLSVFVIAIFSLGTATAMAYYFQPKWVVSIFEYPESIYSNFFNKPKKPEIVDQKLEGNCGARIWWSDNATNEDGVRFYRRVNGGSFNIIEVTGPHAGIPGSFDEGNLPLGTYEYRVGVYNGYGESLSNISEPIVIDKPVCANNPPLTLKPINPVIVSLEIINKCSVRITYNDNSLDEDGLRIYRSGLNVDEAVIADLPAHAGIAATYDDLDPGTDSYQYRVSAYNANGESFSQIEEIEIDTADCDLVVGTNPGGIQIAPTNSLSINSCVWKAAVNVFIRTGPGASVYPEITAVETGTEFPVVGQSEDSQFWVVELKPGTIGYVPKSEKFSIVSGDCSQIPPLADPEPPVIEPVATNKPDEENPEATPIPQCSDRVDNDGDGTVDMRDRECSSPQDTSE